MNSAQEDLLEEEPGEEYRPEGHGPPEGVAERPWEGLNFGGSTDTSTGEGSMDEQKKAAEEGEPSRAGGEGGAEPQVDTTPTDSPTPQERRTSDAEPVPAQPSVTPDRDGSYKRSPA